MDKSNALKKVLIVEIIVLFLAISFIPSTAASEARTGDMPVEHTLSKFSTPLDKSEDPIPVVFGEIGENGWYISAVTITFYYDPKFVDEIHYYLDGDWHLYTGPFNVADDGIYGIEWYWIDTDEKIHDNMPLIRFGLDQTPPTIKLTKKSGLNDRVTFTATVNDPTSRS